MTEKFWFIAPHSINREEGFTPPKGIVSIYKYAHERACADVFVTLMRNEIYGWEQHKKLSKDIVPDRTVYLSENIPTYIEVELAERDRVTEKLANYQRYYRETREQFNVLFLVSVMRDWQAPPQYQFELLSNYIPAELPIDVPDVVTEEISQPQ